MTTPLEPTAPVHPQPTSILPRRWRRHLLLFHAMAIPLVVGGVSAWRSRAAPLAAEATRPDVPYLENQGIVVSPGYRLRAGLDTAEVVMAPLTPLVRAHGMASFNPTQTAAVSTRIKGTLRRMLRVEGDVVKKGDTLAEIESAELGSAQAELTIARAQFKAAEQNANREADLATRKLTTARELELARATLEQQAALLTAAEQKVQALGGDPNGPFGVYSVKAPMGGHVVERRLSVGQAVDGSEVLYRIANLDTLWVELQVFEPHINAIREGDAVELHTLHDSGTPIHARVTHISEVVDVHTRSAELRVEVDNRRRVLRSGQAVAASILATGPAETVLLVPRAAVTLVDGQPTVFVEEAPTRFVPRPVKLGAGDKNKHEVVEGLEAGDRVVTAGVFALKSELFR
jgi:cobalt-zinc-cadmium efflux system membrane fusion protein